VGHTWGKAEKEKAKASPQRGEVHRPARGKGFRICAIGVQSMGSGHVGLKRHPFLRARICWILTRNSLICNGLHSGPQLGWMR